MILLAGLALLGACTAPERNAVPAGLPYFATLQPDEAWGRRGPSSKQPVLWQYQRRGLPLLVVDETPLWRQVRDFEGDTVWMRDFLLTTRHPTAMIIAKTPVPLYRMAGDDENVIAYADPGAILRLGPCEQSRCQLRKDKIRGWAEKSGLWGVDIPAKPPK